MATATLELINPYSKLGLKRRPTYDEIIGLINENETITGKLPDRTATFYKASPEGSFFDGSDALEILKEQQNRIMEREMRDIMMRRNARINGTTFNADRMQASSVIASSAPVDTDRNTLTAQVQADLAELDRRMTERAQQTGEAQREELTRQSAMPTIERFLSGFTSPLRGSRPPVPQIDLSFQDTEQAEEEFFPEEMMTAREEEKPAEPERPKNKALQSIVYTSPNSLTEEQLKFQLFLRGVDVDDPEVGLETRPRGSGRGGGKTPKQFYKEEAQKMVSSGQWKTRIEEDFLKKRIKDYQQKHQSRSSSG